MRLIYADPGLVFYGGHHAPVCERVVAHARARGIQTIVVCSTIISDKVRERLSALALLRVPPNRFTDGDPYCGFMSAYFANAQTTAEDLAKIPDVTSGDIVLFPSAEGPHLLGLAEWLAKFPVGAAPSVVVNLSFEPGLEPALENGKRVWFTRDPRVDPRAATYRHAARALKSMHFPKLHFVTEPPEWADAYSQLLMRRVHLLPAMPFDGPKTLFLRGRRKHITIMTVGYQTAHKGFRLIPEVFAGLLRRPEPLRLVAHNSNPGSQYTVPADDAIAALAARHDHIIADNRVLDAETYQALLDAADILLAPYDAMNFRTAMSGVVTEAIANGIPVVVPADSTMAAEAQNFSTGSTFAEFNAPSVLAATERILDHFDDYAARALAGAERWKKERGCGRFLDEILQIAASHTSA